MNTKKTYDDVWNTWLNDKDEIKKQIDEYIILHKPMYDTISNLVSKRNTSEMQILDVGCGRAIDSYYLASKFGFNVQAIDLSESSLEIARQIGEYFNSKVSFKVGDITNNSYNNKKFDIIFSQGLIEHFPDPTNIIKAQIRLLKEDGYLIIDVPQKYSLTAIRKHHEMKSGKWQWGWEREYSYNELVKLGNSLGLKEVSAYGWWPDVILKRLFYSHILLGTKYSSNSFSKFFYENFWYLVEKRIGHYILSCIGVVFQKNSEINK